MAAESDPRSRAGSALGLHDPPLFFRGAGVVACFCEQFAELLSAKELAPVAGGN